MKYAPLLSTLNNAIAELGPVNNIAPIQKGMQALSDFPELLFADIFLSTAVSLNISHPFWQLCNLKDKPEGTDGGYYFRFYNEGRLPVRKLGAFLAPVGVVVLEENLLTEETLLYQLERNTSQYAALLVLNFTDNESLAKNLKYKLYGKFLILKMADITATSLSSLLDEQLGNELKEKLRERSYLNTLHPMVQLTKEAIMQEQYITGVRKNINGQLSSALRKDEVGANINDTVTSIKTQLQYWNSDVEKAIKVKYEELNKPSTGRYSQHLAKWAGDLTELDKKEVAEKTERLITVINNKFLINFEKQVRDEITADFANDYNFLLSDANSTLNRINHLLSQKGIESPGGSSLSIDYSRFPDPEKTLRNYIGFSRPYIGELSKKGIAEYFAALREHTGSIMVAVGLLAPINMIASATSVEAGEDKTSLWAKISVAMRAVRADINLATAFIIIGMIIWGYFDLRKRIPRKRIEEFERELGKAKDTLQNEGKRMFSDASKDWQANVSQWAREAYTQLQVQMEKIIRDFTAGQQQKLNDEKVRIQRLNQGLDNTTKRIANADKMIDGLLRSHKDAITDLEKSVR